MDKMNALNTEKKFSYLMEELKKIWMRKFTGQLRLNFHEGNLSEKVEKKENIRLERSFDEEFIKPLKNVTHDRGDVTHED